MAKDEDFIVDGIGPLDAGMNSGLVPQLLKPNQTSFSTNATHRGGYIRNRPGLRKINLDFSGDLAAHGFFETTTWQGACFFKSEYGAEGIVTSIGGRLFELTPDGSGGALVRDRSITGDLNSGGTSIAWLWQAERWMIINDGQKLPLFFDGATTRRSRGPSQLVGTLAAPFVAPAVGAPVNITLTAPYAGPFNENIYINGKFYQVNSSGTGYVATLKSRSDTPGTVVPSGTLAIVPGNLIGLLQSVSTPLCTVGPGIPQCVWSLDIAPPQNGTISGITQLIGARLGLVGLTYFYGTAFGANAFKAFGNFGPLPIGTAIYNGYPSVAGIAGTTQANFTVPAVGANVNVTLMLPFNGPLPQTVTIAGGVYDIVAVNNNPVPTNVINVTNINDTVGTNHLAGETLNTIPELGIGRMGAYGLGRVWYSLPDARQFRAGDIVGGSSGSPAVNSRDAVLHETENLFLNGGGNFVVPGNVGDIRSMTFTANLDVSLGQGPLQIGTPTTVFSCNAPVDRTTWQNLTNPILTESLKGKGPLGQYGTILVNSDTIFRGVDGLASLILARRDFDVWGNVPISREMQAVIDLDQDSLLENATAEQFDNRLLMGCLPTRGPLGVFHQGVIAMNLDPVSSLRGKSPSIYDGFWTGLNVLQFVSGTFSGTARSFAFCFNSFFNRIELYELLPSGAENNFDNGSIPILWGFESAALFQNVKRKGLFEDVQLADGEIYISDIRGIVNIQVWFRPDYSECWTPWTNFDICASNSEVIKAKQFRSRIGLGEPSPTACEPVNNRPFRIGSSFQVRFQITGCCKFMGALFKANSINETEFAIPICDKLCDLTQDVIPCQPCTDTGDCLRFPLVFYNLNNNKSYSNLLISFQVTCANDSVQTVYVPAGTINYTLPFPPGFAGPYPPLVLGCVSGGNVVREVPDNATQEQIDALVDEMMTICARAYAESIVQCPGQVFMNAPVTFALEACEDGSDWEYTGTLPAWITLDAAGNQLLGAGGIYQGATNEEATATAQSALDTFGSEALLSGNLMCVSGVVPADIIQLPAQGVGWDDTFSAACFVNGPGGLTYGFGNFKTYTSPQGDGINWTNIADHTGDFTGPSDASFGLGLFEITAGGTRIYNSPDAITWGSNFSASRANTSVTFGNGMFVSCGGSFLAKGGSRSTNGTSWTDFNPGMVRARRVTFGNGMFVMVGNNFEIFSSPDGIVWTSRHSGTPGNGLIDVCFGNNRFFAAGGNGHTLYSDDGMSWTAVDFTMGNAGEEINNICADDAGQVVIVGIRISGAAVDGRIYQSLDNGLTYAFYGQYVGGFKIPRLSYFDPVGNKILLGFRVT